VTVRCDRDGHMKKPRPGETGARAGPARGLERGVAVFLPLSDAQAESAGRVPAAGYLVAGHFLPRPVLAPPEPVRCVSQSNQAVTCYPDGNTYR
jgi:hypothetical protein